MKTYFIRVNDGGLTLYVADAPRLVLTAERDKAKWYPSGSEARVDCRNLPEGVSWEILPTGQS